jgi:uroporphyrinogen III methyltransferase/synthase
MNNGKVYIAGAGCGDPELVTVKLKRVLENADCIVYDRLVGSTVLNYARKDAELVYYGKENTEGGLIQEEINKILVKKAKEGKNTVRLKGGDPFVFGRGGEEILELVKEGIEFELIPGITSAVAVPEYAGIPVSHRGINTSFHIFTGHTKKDSSWPNLEAAAKLEGTLIFLMGVKNLGKICKELISCGKDKNTPAAVIEKGSTAKQRVTEGTLENIEEICNKKNVASPAVIIIGEVVKLRESMKWFEKKDFFGKNILVTRNQEQVHSLSGKINRDGGNALELPFINIKYKDFELPDLKKFKAVLFNSANAVRGLFSHIKDLRVLGSVKIGAVGIKTFEEIEKYKIVPDFFPEEYKIEKLAEMVLDYTEEDDEILVITSDISPFDESIYSEKYKRKFQRLEVYKTEKILRSKEETESYIKESDILTFLSSSTFEAFMESPGLNRKLLAGKAIASIGPVTSDTIRKYGVNVDIEAKKYTAEGLLEEIKNFIKENR